jgi:GT2 family glycosyltransferase
VELTGGGRTWGAGIINHGSYEELEGCLASLARQTFEPVGVFVYDTGVDSERFTAICSAHPDVSGEAGTNVGYAGGANRVVARMRGLVDGPNQTVQPDYLLILNPDIELDDDFAERLIESVSRDPAIAIATGKLLRADRAVLDSAGIAFPRHRRPRDRGSEEPDRGQYDIAERVDAVSGAALLVRTALVDDLSLEGELFDESFFAYHEDTDLCWRARRFGYAIFYEPAAVAVHKRGWQRSARRQIPVEIRRHSFKNHYLQLIKNETWSGLLRNLPWLLGWEVLRLGFVVLKDRSMLAGYREAWRALPVARRRRRLVEARAGLRGHARR